MSTDQSRRGFGERAESARRENEWQNTRATHTVAGRATSAEDCGLLLEMLGLDPVAARTTDIAGH